MYFAGWQIQLELKILCSEVHFLRLKQVSYLMNITKSIHKASNLLLKAYTKHQIEDERSSVREGRTYVVCQFEIAQGKCHSVHSSLEYTLHTKM